MFTVTGRICPFGLLKVNIMTCRSISGKSIFAWMQFFPNYRITLTWDLAVGRGTGTPKDKDEVNKREVSECEGWVWDLDAIGTPSRLRLIRKAAALVRSRPTFLLRWTEKAARRKWNWPLGFVSTRWTPEVPKKRSVSRWDCKNKSLTNSLCNLPLVLGITDINDTTLGCLLL
jgi:hypothetical protein